MTNLRVAPVDPFSYAAWDELVDSSPHGAFFHESLWLSLIRQHMPDQDVRIYGCFAQDALVGGCTLRAQSHFGIRTAIKPWATFYCGFVVKDMEESASRAVLDCLAEFVKSKFDIVGLVNSPAMIEFQPFRDRAFAIGKRRSLVVEAADEDTLWRRVSAHARNAVRKAERNRVRVARSSDVAILSRLYWKSYEGQGTPIRFSRDQFEAICDGVVASRKGELWAAFDALGNPCVALLVGRDSKRAYGLLSGTDREYARNGSGSLLWWEVLRSLAPSVPEMDMVGEGTPGIRRFKMEFNPRVVTAGEIAGVTSLKGRIGRPVLSCLRSVKTRLAAKRRR